MMNVALIGYRGTGKTTVAKTLGAHYGDVSSGTFRIVHNERVLHPFQPYITEATANQIEYFEHVFGLETALSSRDQIWYWKELFGLIALIAALVSLVPAGQPRRSA